MQNELFKIEPVKIETCKTCEHRERHQCNSKIIQYCGVRKSNRTRNGKLKIKASDTACNLYKPEIKRYARKNNKTTK